MHRRQTPKWHGLGAILVGVGLLGACTGQFSEAATSELMPYPDTTRAAAAQVRRLSVREVRNSLRDVFGVTDLGATRFPIETAQGVFDNRTDDFNFPDSFAEALRDAAEATGAQVAAALGSTLPCATSSADDACARQFLDRYGPRAYRRLLAAEERDRLLALFQKTRVTEEFPTAIAAMVEAMMQSPFFIFRREIGEGTSPIAPLAPYEVASSPSYFLWGSTPDNELLRTAADGTLSRHEGVEKQARRLLADDRAKEGLRTFFL